MSDIPEVRWAKSEGGAVAYQTFGTGERALALIVGAISHVELVWQIEGQAAFLRGIANLGRVALYDERGMGASDPLPSERAPTLEERVDDLMAVLDAADVERADLIGFVDGVGVALMAALTYPERVGSLVLVEGYARLARAEDYPIGFAHENLDSYRSLIERFHFDDNAGRANVGLNVPSIKHDPDLVHAHMTFLRRASTPKQFVERLTFSVETDVRDILPLVDQPTLVIHGRRNQVIPVAFGRYLADQIAECKYVELPHGDVPPFFGSREPVLAELSHFFDQAPRADTAPSGRQLATVLFTDIVDSTSRAAEMGDAEWKRLLERHDRMAGGLIKEFRGDLVKTTGDGLLAIFDGPSRAVACAAAIAAQTSDLRIQIRAGLHTGEIEPRERDVAGIAVHVASRIMGLAEPGEVLASSTVRDLAVGSGIEFEDRGQHELKGVPHEWQVLVVTEVP